MAMMPLALAILALAPALQDDPPELRSRPDGQASSIWDSMEGKPFPELSSLTGWHNTRHLTWKDLRGHVVLVHHFAVNKRPAVRLLPDLVDLFQAHKEEGLVILTVHAKRDAESFKSFVIRHGVPHVVAADSSGALGRRVGARKVPAYHLVGRDGRVLIGGVSGDVEAIKMAVTEALKAHWPEPRSPIEYTKRLWTDWRPTEPPPLTLGEDGWPIEPPKPLYSKMDVRGKAAPLHGATHWLTEEVDVRGRPHLYLVWGTNYSTCFPALARMQDLHERFGSQLIVLGVSDQAPDKYIRGDAHPWGETVRDYLATRPGLTYPNVLDGEKVLRTALGVQGMPHALLVDSSGIGRWQGDPMSAALPLTDDIVRQTLMMDRLAQGGTSLTREDTTYNLSLGPPGARGFILALPTQGLPSNGRSVAIGSIQARALGITAPVQDNGNLTGGEPLPPCASVHSLAWEPLRPAAYRVAISATVGN